MRIVGGALRGRRLRPIRGRTIRPTADRVRESLFNILGDSVRGARVLDLFAGTGALGIEALSRGAASAVFLDHYRAALSAVSENLAAFGLQKQARVIRWEIDRNLNCLRSLPPSDLVFMDPPYDRNLVVPTLHRLQNNDLLTPAARIIVEHSPSEAVPETLESLTWTDQRRYGKTIISFFSVM